MKPQGLTIVSFLFFFLKKMDPEIDVVLGGERGKVTLIGGVSRTGGSGCKPLEDRRGDF